MREFYETEYQKHCELIAPKLSELSSHQGLPSWADALQPTLWFVAATRSNTRVLKALTTLATTPRHERSVHVPPRQDTIEIAVAHVSDVSVLDWLYDYYSDAAQRQIRDEHFDALALRCDAIAVVEWVHARGFAFPAQTIVVAASAENLALLRFLHERDFGGDTREAQGSALRNGHLAVLEYLHAHCNDAGCASDAVTYAAKRGRLACVQFANEHNIEGFTVATMSKAVSTGRLDVVKYLHETRTEGCSVVALLDAEMFQYHDVVDFLCRHRPMKNAGPVAKYAASVLLLRLAAKLAKSMITSRGKQQYEYVWSV